MKILLINDLLVINPDLHAQENAHVSNPESLRSALKDTVRALCAARLKTTDWYGSRFLDSGIEIPEDIKSERHALRDWCNAKETELDTMSLSELKAYDATA